ncbi:helix-turn-helix transcriptional regulator [Amycolatopsis minnesotensis]
MLAVGNPGHCLACGEMYKFITYDKVTVSFGGRLRRMRKKLKLRQWEVAERAGLSRDYISVLELSDRQQLKISTLVALAAALEVSARHLVLLALEDYQHVQAQKQELEGES